MTEFEKSSIDRSWPWCYSLLREIGAILSQRWPMNFEGPKNRNRIWTNISPTQRSRTKKFGNIYCIDPSNCDQNLAKCNPTRGDPTREYFIQGKPGKVVIWNLVIQFATQSLVVFGSISDIATVTRIIWIALAIGSNKTCASRKLLVRKPLNGL